MQPSTALCAVLAACAVLRLAYNVWLHPLRHFPGPLASRATVLSKLYHLVAGRLPRHVAALHARHGPVVRIAPGELAFADPRAWTDIYARRSSDGAELAPDPTYYAVAGLQQQYTSLLGSPRRQHDRVRRLLGPGFSWPALQAQEPVVAGCVSLLIQRLGEVCVDGRVVDMRDWLAFCTFDLIGALAFGSDFGCLQNSAYHAWAALVTSSLREMVTLHALRALGLFPVARYLMRKLGVGAKALQTYVELSRSKTMQRVELGPRRHDLLAGLVASGMDLEELRENGSLMMLAGSETTATLLTGAVFLLATHRRVLDRLTAEVRSQFRSEADITLTSVGHLSFMLAVLKESLRCYPPVAGTAPRLVPRGGAVIAGRAVPEGIVVGVWHWAMYHDPTLFADPNRFDPDRFCHPPPAAYAADRLDVVNPFLVGPRNCVGQNLAYAEMRLILARLLWTFDLSISPDSVAWMANQKNYLLWEKPALGVYLRPVEAR